MIRRRWAGVRPALLLVALLPFAAGAAGLEARQVGTHSWYVQGAAGPATVANRGFNSNAGFVITDAGVVVFDALGTPELGRELLAEIRRHTSAPIRRVILSHYHADHAYGLPALRAAGAEVWVQDGAHIYLDSPLAKQRLAQRKSALAQWIAPDFSLPQPDTWLDAGARFELGGVSFDLRYAGPAHSPEDMTMLVLPDGVLFTGDLVFAGRLPYLGHASSAQWLHALDRLDDPRARVLVPGHGAASTDAAAAIRMTRDYLKDLRARMRSAVDELQSFDQAYAAADWSRWRELAAFDESNRANAYAVFLEMEQESLNGAASAE